MFIGFFISMLTFFFVSLLVLVLGFIAIIIYLKKVQQVLRGPRDVAYYIYDVNPECDVSE